jgi:hypothetical protein
MASEARSKGPVLFWCGVAVAEFGAIQPGYGQAWQPAAYAGAALLVALGLIVVRSADRLRSARAGRRLRLAAYLAGTLLVAYHLSAASPSPVTLTALLVYGVASVMAVWSHGGAAGTRGTLLIATDLDPGTLRALLADRAERGQSTVAVYRTERITDELRELQDRYGLVLVVGQEHDPRAKERLSASGLRREVPDIADREVVLAGPRHFTRYVRGALSRLAVPGTQVRTASVRLRQRA